MKSIYFAQQEVEELVEELSNAFSIDSVVSNQQLTQLWSRNYRGFYADFLDNLSNDGLQYSGEQGEMVDMRVNQAQSFTNQLKALVTKQRLNFDVITSNNDSGSMSTAKIGKAVADSIIKNHYLERKAKKAVEQGLVFGTSFIATTWNPGGGVAYTVDDQGEVIGDGDISIKVIPPWDIHYNKRLNDWDELDWVVIREKANRWDLIALYPDLEEELLGVATIRETIQADEEAYHSFLLDELNDDEDTIYVHKFMHKATASMPQGRVVTYCSGGIVLEDTINLYEFLPITPYCPVQVTNYLIGYPMFTSLLPLQEMIDANYSAISTNQMNFGIQNILNPNGNNLNVNDIEGCRFIGYDPLVNAEGGGKPEALQLAQSAPELFNFSNMLKMNMQEMSGVSEVLRGTTPSGVTSGVAIATLAANSVENASDYIHSYVSMLEEVMLKCLKIYKKFVTVERTVDVAGFNNSYEVLEFKGEDLRTINTVRMVTSNPLAQTLPGRITIAQELLGAGLITNVKEYLDVLNTGNVDSATESNSEELDLSRAENNMLTDGNPVIATVLDDHATHILQHRKLLQNPTLRFDPQARDLIARVTEHIQEHVELVNSQDPVLTTILQTGVAQPLPVEQTTLPPDQVEEGGDDLAMPENLEVIQGE